MTEIEIKNEIIEKLKSFSKKHLNKDDKSLSRLAYSDLFFEEYARILDEIFKNNKLEKEYVINIGRKHGAELHTIFITTNDFL